MLKTLSVSFPTSVEYLCKEEVYNIEMIPGCHKPKDNPSKSLNATLKPWEEDSSIAGSTSTFTHYVPSLMEGDSRFGESGDIRYRDTEQVSKHYTLGQFWPAGGGERILKKGLKRGK